MRPAEVAPEEQPFLPKTARRRGKTFEEPAGDLQCDFSPTHPGLAADLRGVAALPAIAAAR